MDLKLKALLSGASTYLPWHDSKGFTGGTDSARYCYSVWLRHLVLGARYGSLRTLPRRVAELGPGDSIGIGLAALLSGSEKYIALDLLPYSNLEKNLDIFEELVALFRDRSPIPGANEFPALLPVLDKYDFPQGLLGGPRFIDALTPDRIAVIRSSIKQSEHPGSMVVYRAPWTAPDVIETASVDLIFSQAVLEHVDDLRGVYAAMRKWLAPSGCMTHQIDFKCHGKANEWNGHWTYSDAVWRLIVGRRSYLLNRQPHSEHVRLIEENGFSILSDTISRSDSRLGRGQLAPKFHDMSDDDLTASGAFIVATAAPAT